MATASLSVTAASASVLLHELLRLPPGTPDWARPLLSYLLNEIEQSPYHFCIEVLLVSFIAYILLAKRSYDPMKKGYGGRKPTDLGDSMREELLADWEPEPLVPHDDTDDDAEAEAAAEAAAAGCGDAASVAAAVAAAASCVPYVIASYRDSLTFVRGVLVEGDARPKVSYTSQDFLGLGADAGVKEVARATLEDYTVGSCGPRGFYGTTRKHLDLEASVARFMRKDESITYSDATATIASAIPAFAKRGDLLLVDARANYGILNGARLSRSKVMSFRHNDLADLRRKLEDVRFGDERARGTPAQGQELRARRFIVVEGLYANTGDLCPLDRVVALAAEFKWRLIVDDSWGFGVLGRTGRGITEHFAPGAGVTAGGTASAAPALLHVEVLVGSLSTSLASVGGFCVGSREVVDHQRLSGQGYCFSASAPPFTCATAAAALDALEARPQLLQLLRAKSELAQRELAAALEGTMRLTSEPLSPIKHLVLVQPLTALRGPTAAVASTATYYASSASLSSPLSVSSSASGASAARSGTAAPLSVLPSRQQAEREVARCRAAEERLLDRIVRHACRVGGVLVSRSHAVPGADAVATAAAGQPSLRVMVTALHSDDELRALAGALKAAAAAVLAQQPALAAAAAAAAAVAGRR